MMKRRAKESISARTTRVAAGRSGERRPAAPIARRSARGGSTPGCRKYSRRWRAISAPSPSVGKTSTKRGARAVDQREQAARRRLHVGFEGECVGSRLRRRWSALGSVSRQLILLGRAVADDSISDDDGGR
jgi:hypothetical protein